MSSPERRSNADASFRSASRFSYNMVGQWTGSDKPKTFLAAAQRFKSERDNPPVTSITEVNMQADTSSLIWVR